MPLQQFAPWASDIQLHYLDMEELGNVSRTNSFQIFVVQLYARTFFSNIVDNVSDDIDVSSISSDEENVVYVRMS